MSSTAGWCTIESDPAVFTEIIQTLEIKNVVVDELLCVDEDQVEEVTCGVSKLYGFIMLFKYVSSGDRPGGDNREETESNPYANYTSEDFLPDYTSEVYFARQMVDNSCATQAIINILLNFPREIGDLGVLIDFYDFTVDLDSKTRGEALASFEPVRSAHNSFARPSFISVDESSRPRLSEDVYHFTSFIKKNNCIYELDGLKRAPIRRATISSSSDSNSSIVNNQCSGSSNNDGSGGGNVENNEKEKAWRRQMVEVLRKRIEELSAFDKSGKGQGISFSICAVIEDPIPLLKKKSEALKSENKPTHEIDHKIDTLTLRRDKGRIENVRRKHNYMPAIVELFKALQEKNKLQAIVNAYDASESK